MIMEQTLNLMRRISRWGLWFGGALVLIAALLIGVDVVLRRFLTMSIGGSDELAGYSLAIGTSWGLAATLIERAHIRIDSLYLYFPRLLRAVLDLLGLALFLFFFGLMAWHGMGVVEQSWISGSRSQSALQIPTILPQSLWLTGLVLFIVVGLLLLLQGAIKLKNSEWASLRNSIGIRSAEEDVDDEIAALKRRQSMSST